MLLELAVKQPGGHAVAGEAGGLVDHDGVESAAVVVAGFLGERGPAGAVVPRAALLVEEFAHDLAAQLGGLALGRLEL